MKNIRAIIICTALVLIAWLAASYTTDVHFAQDPSSPSKKLSDQTSKEAPLALHQH